MRIGFVGTGQMASFHAGYLKKLDAEISLCFDVNKETLKSFCEKHGGQAVSRREDVVDKDKVDAIYIVTPPCANDGVIEYAAIDAGIPFLCEKPLTLDLALARKIAGRIEKAGLVATSGFVFRDGEISAKVKEITGRNRVSMVRSARMVGPCQNSWQKDMKLSGGIVLEVGIHHLDFLRWVFGDVESVAASASYGINSSRFENWTIEDAVVAQLKFESGVIGDFSISEVMSNAQQLRPLDVFGQDFMLCYEGLWGGDKIRYKEGSNDWQEIPIPNVPTKEHNEMFLNAVKKNDPALLSGSYQDAVKTLQLAMAIVKSCKEGGRRVKVAEL